jgi:tetratricopeptide (TPR) repeat protein
MIMSFCHRNRLVALMLSIALAGVAAAAPVPSTDGNAATLSAESALQRGDCGAASTLYLKASQLLAQAELAQRATAVALECGQVATALAAAGRWVKLAPGDTPAALARVRAALAGFHIPEAQEYFRAWLGGADRKVPEAIDELAQGVGNEALLLMLRGLDHPVLRSSAAQRALAELALESWDANAALKYAQGARTAGARSADLAALVSRAQAVLGNEPAALAAAHEAVDRKDGDAGGDGALAVAQALLLLGKSAAAEAELQRLRSDTTAGTAAGRQLAQLAFEQGDYALAEQRSSLLLRDPASSVLAVYLLGVIAERRGDEAAALRHYAALLDTGFDAAGRRRAAGILYRQGEHEAALRVFAPARNAGPAERIRADIAVADLLSLVDAPEESLGRIDGALRRSPGNPELDYQRAVLLERAGKIEVALKLLESLHLARPLDAAVTNALGYTLADHKRALPRAEQLIREALQSQPDSPSILDSLGWVLYRRGQAAAAVPVLARAYRLLHDGDVGAHWGEALWGAGQHAAARAAWQRALAADPDNKGLNATLAKFAPDIRAPVPPPALEAAPRTSI